MKYLRLSLALLLIIILGACKEKPPVVDDEDTTPPLILGVNDVAIFVGDPFDPMDGVSANDDVDGLLTNQIVITGAVNNEEVGSYELTYKVSDKAGNEASKKRTVTVLAPQAADLYIRNGDFSQDISLDWGHWNGDGGTSTLSIEDGMMKYEVTANGTQWYSNQVYQKLLTVTKGKVYKLTFQAKSSVERAVRIKIETDGAPYTTYMDYAFIVTTEMQTFTYEFPITLPTLTNAKFIIGIGNMNAAPQLPGDYPVATVYFDNFVVEEVELGPDTTPPVLTGVEDKAHKLNEPFDPLSGVTVSDDRDDLTTADITIDGTVNVTVAGEYTLTYTVSDKAGNETVATRKITVTGELIPTNLVLINGDFEIPQPEKVPQPADTGWGWHGDGKFNVTIADGIAKIDITNLGPVAWGVQFYQQNRIVDENFIYEIKFDAKADIPRPIMFALEKGTTRQYDEIFDLTTEWTTYTIRYHHTKEGFTNGKFAFFMGVIDEGSVPTSVYLDNITVETIREYVDETAPKIFGAHDAIIVKDAAFDNKAGIKVYDNNDKLLTVDDIVIEGNVDVTKVGVYTLTYKLTDKDENSVTVERKVEVVEALTYENKFTIVNGNFETAQADPVPQPAETGWGWHGGGAFTVAIAGGAEGTAVIDVTGLGTVPHGVQFYQQNRKIEAGSIYKLTFKMKASVARDIRLSLEAGTDVRWFKVMDVTTEWQTYEVYITPSGNSFTNGKFAFFLGKVSDTSVLAKFEIDDVSIDLVGYRKDYKAPMMFFEDIEIPRGTAFDKTAGVVVFDIETALKPEDVTYTGELDILTPGVYTLTYELKDKGGNVCTKERKVTVLEGILPSRVDLINGDFSSEQAAPISQPATTGWGWHGGGAFTVSIPGGKDGVATIEVTNPGAVFYGVQFYQQNKIIDKDSIYEITFRAKSSVPRTMQFSIEGGGGSNYNEYVWLTEEWQNYKLVIKNTKETFNTAKIAFFLGLLPGYYGPSTVQIDDVKFVTVEEIVDTEAPFIFGAPITIKQNQAFDPKYGLTVHDNLDKALTVEDIVVVNTLDVATLGEQVINYKITDAAGNERTFSRKITVVAEEAFKANEFVIANSDFATAQTESLGNDGWNWKNSGTGAYTVAMAGGAEGTAVIDVTNLGTVPHGVQFFQQNRKVEAVGLYELTFKMKASVARDVRLSLEAGTDVRWFKVIDVTTDWVTYSVIISANGGAFTNGKLGFFLGKVSDTSVLATFELDDVQVKLIGYQS